jgi:hypothetical protein
VEASSCRCSQIHIEQIVISCILPVFRDSNVTPSCVWLETAVFFTSFTAPKLYSCYSIQIHNKGVTHLPLFVQCVFVVCGNQSGIRLKSELPCWDFEGSDHDEVALGDAKCAHGRHHRPWWGWSWAADCICRLCGALCCINAYVELCAIAFVG